MEINFFNFIYSIAGICNFLRLMFIKINNIQNNNFNLNVALISKIKLILFIL